MIPEGHVMTNFFSRAEWLVSVLCTFSRKGLALGVLLLGLAVSSQAEDCEVEQSTGEYVGSFWWTESYSFSELEEITEVVEIDVSPGGFFTSYSCPVDRYYHEENILTVKNGCRAIFKVKGIKKDCEPDVQPVDDGIAQKPLFLTQSVPPNVMYILDDSGSMQFELMPDDIIFSSARYIYPRASGVYGGSDYSNYVPTVDDNNGFNARSRSPQVNSVYYNPSKTYQPWIKADGSRYPDATPSCALHNPERGTDSFDASRCRNLTTNNSNYNSNRWYSCNSSGSCSYTTSNKTYWPAKYFWYKGSGDTWTWNNYTEVEIRSGLSYTGHGREFREDCANRIAATCSYAEEIQNFANWYTYYRSRVLTARAGSGFAFATQGGGLRVGFGSINQNSSNIDGEDTTVIVNGVRPFEGENREKFFDALYTRTIPNAGTPLRKAVDAAGSYFSRDDNKGPWGNTPGTDDSSEQLSCRRNYTVLTTDGYWSGSSAGGNPAGNNDGSDNPTHSRPAGSSYTYSAKSPFKDNRNDTLADVAMYYWKNDLRPNMENLVSETKDNPAFWQHMVTYGVGIGVAGSVDPDTAFAAIKTGTDISWPDPKPSSATTEKIDDLLHASVNSRGGFFSASEPDVFANELSGVLQTIANESKSSASSVAANSTRLDSGTLVYQASFNSLEWSGRIQAYSLNDNGSLKNTVWDTHNNGIPAHGVRNIITTVGDPGAISTTSVAFNISQWDSFTSKQRAALQNGSSVDMGKFRLNWLRGDQSKEGSLFRQRSQVLGDIVNSDPYFVGATEDFGYNKLSGTEGSSYTSFLSSKASRTPMIYVGANDGMLHGFDAGTGKEKFAFVPASVFPNLSSLTEPDYEHRYFVDGSPRAVDAYIGGSWKTVLVGATGAGGRSVFALNVTDPGAMGPGSLLWEFSTAADATDKLGVAMSQPTVIRVAADNKWVAIFGNGYASGDTVKLFVVDLASGELIKTIDTGVDGVDNGLSSPVPVDINNDRITDYVYAGDLKGNLWKFSFTGASTASWSVAYSLGNAPRPLYKFVDANGTPQAVTSRPTVGLHPEGGSMVYVGTGKYFEVSDAGVPGNPQIQDFYGIRDNGSAFAGRDKLLTQTIVFEGTATGKDGSTTSNKIRLVSNNGAGSPPTYGWHLRLLPPDNTATGERVVSPSELRNGRIIFATIIPSNNTCGYGGSSFLMELDAINGGRISDPVLDVNSDGKVDYLDVVSYNGDYLPVSGIGIEEMIKTPGIIGAGELEYKYTSGSSGSIGVITESAGEPGEAGRQSWRQLQ
jgi:type IV pilus assembly protein PilY1